MTDILEELKAAKDAAEDRDLVMLFERAISKIEESDLLLEHAASRIASLLEQRDDALLRLNAYLRGNLRLFEEPT